MLLWGRGNQRRADDTTFGDDRFVDDRFRGASDRDPRRRLPHAPADRTGSRRSGPSKAEIEAAKENEQWDDTIVYELRISGDKFLLTATSDDDNPTVEDQGTFIVDGQTLHMTYVNGEPEYTMRFSVSDGELRLKLLENPCGDTHPEQCSDFLVRAAYEALPFEAVS